MVSDVSASGEYRAAQATLILNVDDTAAARYAKSRVLRRLRQESRGLTD